jgi:mitogen-activated protein kinase kinase kinase
MSELNIAMFINRLTETGHCLVFAEDYQATGTYIIAEGALADRKDQIPNFLRSAFQVVVNPEDVEKRLLRRRESTLDHQKGDKSRAPSVSQADHPPTLFNHSQDILSEETGAIDDDLQEPGETFVNGMQEDGRSSPKEKLSAYLIVFRPSVPFLWQGRVLLGIDMPTLDLGVGNRRLMLISEGGQTKLAAAKTRFASHFIFDDEIRLTAEAEEPLGYISPVGTLPVQVEQRSHLPTINKELARITRATNRLAFKIVESIQPVRKALRGIPGYQELLQNWFLFASEHAHQQSPGIEFTRALTNLAIFWVSFICDDCDSTDRKTFKWAVTALEFAKNRVGSSVILQLPNDQFTQLRRKVAMCMSLLIRHFDILGARSSTEARQARERQEEIKRHLAMESKIQTEDDQFLKDIALREDDRSLQSSGFISTVTTKSIQWRRDEVLQQIRAVEQSRDVPEGRVLDDNVPEDRTLFLLASSHSNVSIRWQQGKLLGRGAFGSVYLASNMDTGTLMAVKEIHFQDVAGLLPSLYKSIQDELSIMEMLRHPNIVEYYGIEVHRDRVYIFEEYCSGGSLANLLDLGRIEDEMVIQMYALQMLDGLDYLHMRNVVHRDIKPDSEWSA